MNKRCTKLNRKWTNLRFRVLRCCCCCCCCCYCYCYCYCYYYQHHYHAIYYYNNYCYYYLGYWRQLNISACITRHTQTVSGCIKDNIVLFGLRDMT